MNNKELLIFILKGMLLGKTGLSVEEIEEEELWMKKAKEIIKEKQNE